MRACLVALPHARAIVLAVFGAALAWAQPAPAVAAPEVGGATAATAAAPASAAATDELTRRILALEQLGRARHAEAKQQLDALLPTTPVASPQRLELVSVLGLMAAVTGDAAASERLAATLEAWGNDASAAQARGAGAAALLVRARTIARSGNLARADTLMQDAMTLLPADAPARQRFRFVYAQAFIKEEAGKLEGAVRLNHEALALADAHGEAWRRSEARSALAYSYVSVKQLDRARALATEAVKLAEQADDGIALGRAHNVAAIVFDGLGDATGVRREFEAAIEAARRAGSRPDEVRYLANLTDSFLKNGDYKTALARAERALVLARELQDTNSETVALANMGLASIAMHQLDAGKRLVDEAIAIDERRGSLTGVSEVTRELGQFLERAGDLPGAVAAYHRHRLLDAKLLHQDQQKAIVAIQEQYEADRRSRALALLDREGEIQAEELRRRDLQQGLWWLLALVLGASFAVIALLYRRVVRAVRQLSISNERLKLQGEHDPLTGLSNRRHFQAAMQQRAADQYLDGTLYLLDIDHFKRINDRHGHAAGDAVLVETARRLRETLREDDLIVRWGGEEFLIVVRSPSVAAAELLAERLLAALGDTPFEIGQAAGVRRIAVTASIGLASFPLAPARVRVPWETAVELVDSAMYLAKAQGRDRACSVRQLRADDGAGVAALARALDTAWHDGRAELAVLRGQALREAA